MNKVVLANILISETSLRHQLSLFIPESAHDACIQEALKQKKIQEHKMLIRGLCEEIFYTNVGSSFLKSW